MKKGLTLIEVLVAMGISVVAGALLLVIIVNSAGIFSKESSKVQEGLNINDALAKFRASIKQASSVASAYTSGPTIYTTGPNMLVLKVLSIDSSGNIIADTYDYFVFYPDQGILHFKIFPEASLSSRQKQDQILSADVENLNLKYFNSAVPPEEVVPVNATKVRITLTLKQRNGIGFETSTVVSEANLRND